MGCYAMGFPLAILSILSLSIFHATAQFTLPPLLGDPCAKADCGQGRCVNSSASLLGFDCVCDPGWTKIEVGPLTFSPCIIPNCWPSSQYGNGAPPPPPPPLPPLNFSSPCNLVWCGDGNCVVNGTTHYCQCNDGSDNIFNATALPCFKEWYFEVDCQGVQLGRNSPPPVNGEGNDQNQNSPSPNPQGNGSDNVPKLSWSNGVLTTFLLITILLLIW